MEAPMAIGMATAVGAAQDLGLSGVGDLLTTQLNDENAKRKRKAAGANSSPLKALQGQGTLGGAFEALTGERGPFGTGV